MIAIVAILAASFVWYNDDGGGGSDTTEDSEPVLSNYINTSSFFEAYKDGAMISVFKMPYQLEPVGNVIELRPNDRVSSVSDNGDGTYNTFTLVYDTGVTHTMTVEFRNVSNLVSSVSDGIVTLTFDALGEVTLIVDADVYGGMPPGDDTATVTGYNLQGKGWSIQIDGTPVESIKFPVTIPKTGAVIQIVGDADLRGEYYSESLQLIMFFVPNERHSYSMKFQLDGAVLTESSYDSDSKTLTLVVDCESSMSINVNSAYGR